MASQLKLDQVGLSAGVAGKSRTDGKDDGSQITLTNTGTGSTTLMQLLDVPIGDTTSVSSLTVTGNPKVWTLSPTALKYGTLRVRLIEDSGLLTQYVETRTFRILTPGAGLAIPAVNEQGDPTASLLNAGSLVIAAAEDNSDDYDNPDLNTRRWGAWWRVYADTVLKLDHHLLGRYPVGLFGAVARDITDAGTSDAERTVNVLAIQAALDAALVHGGTVYVGPGVYYTNARVGYFLAEDKNAPVIIQGLGGYGMIYSNNDTQCVLGFLTTDGNIRDLAVKDIMLHGGREGLLLYNCDYSVFENIWGWGSKNFAFQCQFCVDVAFKACRFDESAQGNATGVQADAVMLLSCEVEFDKGTRWGEFCGGILMSNGYNVIGGLFHDCKLRRGIFFDYLTNTIIDNSALLARPAAISLSGGYCLLTGCWGESVASWVLVFRGVELEIGDVRIQAAPGFVGFVDVWPNGSQTSATNLALKMGGVYQFNDRSGFLVQDLESSLQNAVINCQTIVSPGGSVTPLATSAPLLLNPNFEGNSVVIEAFSRFIPTDVAQLTAWLRVTHGTITGSGYASVPDKLVANPAVQTVDARRPVNGLSPTGFPTMAFSAANNSSLSWPLVTSNNQASKTGFACWVKQPVSAAGFEAIFAIGGGTGGANVQKFSVLLLPNQAVNIQLFANNSGGRQGTTATGVFAANTWFFLRYVYDSTQSTEATRSKLYINEALIAQTFSDLGVGSPVTTLQVGTGNALIGNADDSGSTTRTFNGFLGSNMYVLAGDVSAPDGVSLMGYRPPV